MPANTSKLEQLETDRFLAQAEMLAQLQDDPCWPGWVQLLTDMRTAALEELARCSDPGDFRYWQGVVAAFGEMLERPRRVVLAASQVQEAEEARNVIRPDLRAIIGLGADHEGDV